MEAGQGRWQVGPGKLHVWSVRPVRDLSVSSLYRELLEYVHSDIARIREAFRLRHLEDLKHPSKFVSVAPDASGESYPLHAFSGSIPYSLMRSEIPVLYDGRRRYVYLYKGDGQRLRLYFARIRGKAIVFFMTRPGFFCLLPTIRNLPEQLFEGTKLDVELIYQPEHESRRLEVFDAIAIRGLTTGHYNFVKRLHLYHYLVQFLRISSRDAKTTLIDSYSPLNNYEVPYSPRFPSVKSCGDNQEEQEMMADLGITEAFRSSTNKQQEIKKEEEEEGFQLGPYRLIPKRAYSIWELHELLFEVVPRMPSYAREGLIGMPDEDPILPGACPNIKKIKIGRRLNTLDLLCGKLESRNEVGWWAELPARHEAKDAGKRTVMEWRDTRVVLFEVGRKHGDVVELVREDGTAAREYRWQDLYGKILECRMDEKDGKWTACRLRDKRKPNTLETCLRTVENMDLSYKEIFPFLDPTRPAPVLLPSQRAMQLDPTFGRRIWMNQKNKI